MPDVWLRISGGSYSRCNFARGWWPLWLRAEDHGPITDAIANPARYSINGTQYLLIEFSDYGIPPNVAELLLHFTNHGLVPIVTHPERNPLLVRRPEKILEMIDAGALIQVTANSITGFWGEKARSISEWLLAQGFVHVIASDAHDPKRRRPVLSEARNAVARMLGEDMADHLVSKAPRAIIEGQPLIKPGPNRFQRFPVA